MRLTPIRYRHNIGRMFKKHWRIQSKRVPVNLGAEEELRARDITIYDTKDIIEEKREFVPFLIHGFTDHRPQPKDHTHPLYHERICHMYRDHNVLLQGLEQGKILTKTVELKDGLPLELEKLVGVQELPEQDKLVQRCIFKAHLFDAMQVKLPKIRDPERPARVFPRVYGIDAERRMNLLSSKLIQLCESTNTENVSNRILTRDDLVAVSFEKDEDLIRFELTVDFLLNSVVPLPAFADADEIQRTQDIILPDLYPIKHIVTLEKENIYQSNTIFPVLQGSRYPFVHTAIFHFDETEVKNLYETPVTEEQFMGRTLLKSFALACAQAKQRFGDDVKDLPSPVTLQCVHTDGRIFHFAVLQLNTLDLEGTEGKKNIFWMLPRIPLFDSCSYVKGRPVLEGYNPEVFSRLLSFYSNGFQL